MTLFRRGHDAPAGVVTEHGPKDSADLPQPADQRGREPFPRRAARFARRHSLFGGVLLAAVAVRVIVLLGFRGPMVTPGSADYVAGALRFAPGLIRPSGYSAMLWLFRPWHSLRLIVHVRPHQRLAYRCGICGKSGPVMHGAAS